MLVPSRTHRRDSHRGRPRQASSPSRRFRPVPDTRRSSLVFRVESAHTSTPSCRSDRSHSALQTGWEDPRPTVGIRSLDGAPSCIGRGGGRRGREHGAWEDSALTHVAKLAYPLQRTSPWAYVSESSRTTAGRGSSPTIA